MSTLEELKNTPIKIDPWMIAQVGFDNDGPYKDKYPKIRVVTSDEPLINISEFGIVSSDFYLNQFVSGETFLEEAITKGLLRPSAYLRESHAKRLQKVDEHLRKMGYFLHVQSGWRHPDLQQLVIKEYERKHGDLKAKRLFAQVLEGSAPPPHSTGAAFDLEIRSLKDGRRQELYCSVGNRTPYGAPELEYLIEQDYDLRSNSEVRLAVENRRVLYHCLCTKGVVFDNEDHLFTPHPGECWHFGDGDPLSSYLRQEKFARFGFVEPIN